MLITLKLLPNTYTMFQIDTLDDLPIEANMSELLIVARSRQEISVLCEGRFVPNAFKSNTEWRLLKFSGSIDENLIGTVSMITSPLALHGISVIVHTTYDFGYFGVRVNDLLASVELLRDSNIQVC